MRYNDGRSHCSISTKELLGVIYIFLFCRHTCTEYNIHFIFSGLYLLCLAFVIWIHKHLTRQIRTVKLHKPDSNPDYFPFSLQLCSVFPFSQFLSQTHTPTLLMHTHILETVEVEKIPGDFRFKELISCKLILVLTTQQGFWMSNLVNPTPPLPW